MPATCGTPSIASFSSRAYALRWASRHEPDPPSRRDRRRRCGGVFATDGGGRGRHVVGTLLSLSAAGPMFEAYRKRARELGWTAGPDPFAYAAVVGVGATREEGLRRANL